MGLAYVSQEDVAKRLENTICFYDGNPVFVSVPQMDVPLNTVTLIPVPLEPNKRGKRYLTTDPKFNHNHPELGYMNFDKQCHYTSRVPRRRQKQGLCTENVAFIRRGRKLHYLVRNELHSVHFVHMLKNEYPSFNLALSGCVEGVHKGCAFHKHAAIQKIDGRTIGLLYRGRLVALYNEKTNKFDLLMSLRDPSYVYIALKTLGVPT